MPRKKIIFTMRLEEDYMELKLCRIMGGFEYYMNILYNNSVILFRNITYLMPTTTSEGTICYKLTNFRPIKVVENSRAIRGLFLVRASIGCGVMILLSRIAIEQIGWAWAWACSIHSVNKSKEHLSSPEN